MTSPDERPPRELISEGEIRDRVGELAREISADFADANPLVLVVEDIVDTGQTLEYLLETLGPRRPASLSTCALVRKRTAPEATPSLDYLGFEIPDEWVVGYGLDYGERYRTLPYIGILDQGALRPSDRR